MVKLEQNVNRVGYLYLTCFLLLIAGGIICKRVYGHPEFMMLFHLPAAVFLVLGGQKIMRKSHQKYIKQQSSWEDIEKK